MTPRADVDGLIERLNTRRSRLVAELCNVIHQRETPESWCGKRGPYGHEPEAEALADYLFAAGWCERPDDDWNADPAVLVALRRQNGET